MRHITVVIFLTLIVSNVFAKELYLVNVDGIITNYTYKYLKSNLDKVSKSDSILVVKLDTPGGILESTRKIVQLFFESKIPIVVHIAPNGARAASAGAFIALSANYLVMAEGTHIGAAHPVNVTGEDIKGDMRAKVENDTTAFMRSIAQMRKKNEQIAVDMVLKSISLTAKEAYEKKLADSIANSDDELVQKIKERFQLTDTPVVKPLEPTIIEKIAFFLSDPNIIAMLILISIAAIFLEFKIPGSFIFASIGIAALILFLLAINIIPINYLGLILILAGIALLIAEIFITSFGLLTIAGITALASGMYILFHTGGNMGIRVSYWLIAILILFFGIIVFFIGKLVIKDLKKKSITGAEGLIGETGIVLEWNDEKKTGKGRIHGEIWTIKSMDTLKEEDRIKVIDMQDFTLMVRRIE